LPLEARALNPSVSGMEQAYSVWVHLECWSLVCI
jgi:hypothetical protein